MHSDLNKQKILSANYAQKILNQLKAHMTLVAVISSTAVCLLSPSPAEAVVVTVGGIAYDVTEVETSYNLSSSTFQAFAPGKMPWWGNESLAYDFALEVYDALGEGSTAGYGPVFAHAHDASLAKVLGILQNTSNPLDAINDLPAASATVKYAIASAPVPGPLPLFGAAAAFGWSRRLRQRIDGC